MISPVLALCEEFKLSSTALTIAAMQFGFNGDNTSLQVNGVYSEHRLTDEYQAGMDELVTKGYVVATEFGKHHPGRMIYRGTDRCRAVLKAAMLELGIDLTGLPSLSMLTKNTQRKK